VEKDGKQNTGAMFQCAILFGTPFVASWAATLIGHSSGIATPWSEDRLRIAHYGLVGLGVYMFASAFVLEWAFRRSADRLRTRGLDPRTLIMQSTMASAVTPSIASLFLSFVSGSVQTVYAWSAMSVVIAAFRCIRYRRVLAKKL